MSLSLEKLKEYTQEKRGSGIFLNIEVPEVGETYYFKPLEALTQKDFDAVLQAERKNNVDGMIDMLIIRALDENGNRKFKQVDRTELRRLVSPTLITDICARMSNAELEYLENNEGGDAQSELKKITT